MTATHEAARSLLGGGSACEALSVEPLWQHCVNAGNASHYGTTVGATADALHSAGQPFDVHWPYDDTLGEGTEPTPLSAANVDWYVADMVEVPLAHDGVEDEIENALAVGFPVLIIVELTAEFEDPDERGEIAVPAMTSPLGDYHAVVAVGAQPSSDGSTRRLLIRNSWGPGWGAGGYGWMPVAYLRAFAVEAAVLDPRTDAHY